MNDTKDRKMSGDQPKGVTRITAAEGDPIASALRQLYDDAVSEPLPDHLTQLLDRLDAAERSG